MRQGFVLVRLSGSESGQQEIRTAMPMQDGKSSEDELYSLLASVAKAVRCDEQKLGLTL